jgi:predicted glycoside hydrolase/deacetylase ChbG (UPF0249 family)
MTGERYLIVNADDFGQSHEINHGIIETHQRGIVTSASLMVRWPAAVEAAAYSRDHRELSIGLHFDFGEWAYRHETWVPLYEVVPVDDPAAVADDVSRQLAIFRGLVGTDPTHIDSHQHVHRAEPVSSILVEIARQLGVPLRHHSPVVNYCGNFYGQSGKGDPCPDAISVAALIRTFTQLSPGITELGCHPGNGSDLDSMYRNERAQEVKVLCDSRVRAALVAQGIELCSFRSVLVRTNQPAAELMPWHAS